MSERVSKETMACNKPRRTPGHPKKSHIVKACFDGKEKLIRFGEQGASTAGKPKEGESERMKTKRASFKARHAKNIAKGPSSPAYWADRVKWNEGGMVKMAAGGSAALALIEQMRRSGARSQEFDPVLVAMREQRARPARRSVMPQAAPRMPEPQAEALPLPPVPPSMRPDENPPPEAPRTPMRFDEGNPYVATAIRMAEKYGLPSNIFLALVQQESRFDPNARSRRGAIGLGQLMPGTARELGVDPTDPEQNLEGSARYLRRMLDQFGDMSLALAAYNAGPGTVRRAGNTIPNIRETQNYVPSILRRAGVSGPEGFAEGGLADLDEKYAEGGRVGRTLRDELRDIEAEIRGERPASLGVTIARGFGEDFGGIAGTVRRAGASRLARPEEPPMIAMHNTRPERLERMDRSGGVAVAPSIAIARADNPIDSFGDVSLLASPQTVDPRSTPVYARDAYTPRYPDVETRKIRGEDREVIRVYNENTGEWRNLPHTPENALRVMRREPWRGGEDFITDNWLLAQIAPQFRNMSELRGARDRLVLPTDTNVETWTKGLDDLRSEWSKVLSESGRPTDWRFADSLQRNLAEAAQRGPGGMDYINRTYYNNAIPEDLLARTRAHLEAGRELPTTYFEAKPRRIVPLSEFEGAVVPFQAPQDLTDMLRRYGIEDIRYYTDPAQRAEQVRRFERLMFGAAPVAAGAAMAAGEGEPEGYAEGGEVMSDEEYDRRLLSRMKEQTGRVTEPTRAEQMQALRTAGRSAAEGVADVLLPQSPLDFALMAALGPGGRAARLAGSAALASLEPSEAEASRLRRLIRAYHGSPHKFDEFDIRKIGTGEGNQAFGRGLYFAENEDIAKYYRDKLAGSRLSAMENVLADLPENLRQRAISGLYYNKMSPEDVADMLSMTRAGGAVGRENLLESFRRAAAVEAPSGHMYEVDLNASPRDFLNWDAPLSQQSPEVRDAFASAAPDVMRYWESVVGKAGDTGGFQYGILADDLGGKDIGAESARIALMRAGIPGTRYFDAGSRGVGGGTYNYAVFDPEIIDIVRRYAKGGLAELENKYAEGGEVSAMTYDPDAVDALVKQIEAEYV